MHAFTTTRAKLVAAAAAGIAIGTIAAPASVQAAVNYFDTTRIVYGPGSASCPAGWRLTGGGVAPLPANYYGSISSDEYALTGSYPYSTTTWKATATRVHGSYAYSTGWRFTSGSYSPRTYAVCAS